MVVNFASANRSGSLNRNQLEHSILRNFGGFDPEKFNPLEVFKKHLTTLQKLDYSEGGLPPVDSMELIKYSISGSNKLQG